MIFKKNIINIFFIFLLQFLMSGPYAVEPDEILLNKKKELMARNISKNIRCLICQGQSVYDSNSDFALSIKITIEKKLDDGFSESEIYDYLKTQYGEWIVYNPEFNKNTLILWILPILLFFIGGAIITKKLFIKKI